MPLVMGPTNGIRGYELDHQQTYRFPNKSLHIDMVRTQFSLSSFIEIDSSAVAITESIIFVVFPHTLYEFAIDFVLGKREFSLIQSTRSDAHHIDVTKFM